MSGYGPTQQKKRAGPTPTNGTSARIPGDRRTIVEKEP